MSGRVLMRLFLPVVGDVSVKSISAQSRYESAKIMVTANQKGKFNKLSRADKLDFKFKSSIKTKEFCFVLDDITNKDHDVLHFLNWRIEGNASGGMLFNSAD